MVVARLSAFSSMWLVAGCRALMRTYPAIEIHFTPEALDDDALRDRLAFGLDDFHPTAIQEAAAGWRIFLDSPAQRDAALAWLRDRLADRRLTPQPLDVEDDDW